MSMSQTLAPHLPYLRRYARALTGSQASGDTHVRAALTALGARTTLMAPVIDLARPERARAVLITAMSSSGRTVNEDDLADLAQFARDLSPRLHW